MFDTRQSDYRITAPDVPFHTDRRANIAKEVFNAFREQDFGIGAYFSKPDWHTTITGRREWATPNRHVNYDTRKYPERWQRFRDFTYRRSSELALGLRPARHPLARRRLGAPGRHARRPEGRQRRRAVAAGHRHAEDRGDGAPATSPG